MLKSMSLACGAVLLFGCAPPFDPQAEGKKLLTRDAEWADAASAGRDVDKTVSYWSEDAVIIPQGQKTIEGRAAIRAFVDGSFHTPGFHIHWTSEKPLFSPDGKFAYLRSTTETTVPGPNGTTVTFPSRGLTVWRVDPDGEWRCVVDIWNDPPPQAHASVKAGTADAGKSTLHLGYKLAWTPVDTNLRMTARAKRV